jgi:hypothetical protein
VKEAYESCDEGTEVVRIIEDYQNGIAETSEGMRFRRCLEEMIQSAGIITQNITQQKAV